MNCLKKISFIGLNLFFAFQGLAQQKPNIIFVLADDMGYGDVSCLNPGSKINTANMDKLAAEGMIFTNAHSSSAVCTPSRYSILTGRYNWRTSLQSYVLDGYSPPLINPATYTLAQFFKDNGYQTACIGKWHLGLGWQDSSGHAISSAAQHQRIDYSRPVLKGPTSLGFDTFYGISASLDMPPFTYIDNNKVAALPATVKKWVRSGPAAPDFDAVNVLPEITQKAEQYIIDKASEQQPFFLYFALTSPHTPIVPGDSFKGKSQVTAYGDFVLETDWALGRVMHTLDSLKITDNTIVVMTSDNGFAPYVLPQFNVEALGHYPSYVFRGYKSDAWEGGHHIPFIVRWPAVVRAGTRSDHLVGQLDFFATCAGILKTKLPGNAAVDSYSFLPVLAPGKANSKARESMVYHSIDGYFAIQKDKWKLILCPGSGGWSDPDNKKASAEKLPAVQLYDMEKDIGERDNLADRYPEKVAALTRLLNNYIKAGRSTAGPGQTNDTQIDVWKKEAYQGRKK